MGYPAMRPMTHLCGAYLKNNARRYGLRDRTNNQINDDGRGYSTPSTLKCSGDKSELADGIRKG